MTGADRRFVNGFVTGPGGRKSLNGADQGENPRKKSGELCFPEES